MSELPLEVSCTDVKSALDSGESFLLVDCRETQEHETAAIAQAMLLPMSEIQDRVSEIQSQQSDRIVVHCHHGGRSLQVAQWLRGQGFDKAQSMQGGIDQWSQEIDTSVPRY